MPIQRTFLPDGRALITGEDEITAAQVQKERRLHADMVAAEAERQQKLEREAVAAMAEAAAQAQAALKRAERLVEVRQAFEALEEERFRLIAAKPLATRVDQTLSRFDIDSARAAIRELLEQLEEVAPFLNVLARHVIDVGKAMLKSEFNRTELIEQDGVAKLVALVSRLLDTAPPSPSSPTPTKGIKASNVVAAGESPSGHELVLSQAHALVVSQALPEDGEGLRDMILISVLGTLRTLCDRGGYPTRERTSLAGVRYEFHAVGGASVLVRCLNGYGTHKNSFGSIARVAPRELEVYKQAVDVMTTVRVRGHCARAARLILERAPARSSTSRSRVAEYRRGVAAPTKFAL